MKKKLLSRIPKPSLPFRKKAPEVSSRITTDTIAEHRERVLAGGRRFKYPLQYARHRLVFNTVIIVVVLLIALIVIIGWQLYKVQNSSDFMYRVTRVVPLPVASVDGQPVPYSDYLMRYRSSIHYKVEKEQVSLNTPDGKRQDDQVKRQEMDNSIADAYATKLAGQLNINVPDSELQLFLKQQRQSASGEVSEVTYDAVILDYYGWEPDEYQQAMYNKLLDEKVSYGIDTQASNTVAAAEKLINAGNADLQSVATSLNNNPKTIVTFANSGLIPKTNQDGGLATAAAALKVGEVSSVVKPTDGNGYYILKLVDSNDAQVNYDYIHVTLTAFNDQLAALKKDNKVHEYISIPK